MVRRRKRRTQARRARGGTDRFNLNFETVGIAITLVLLVFIAAMMFV